LFPTGRTPFNISPADVDRRVKLTMTNSRMGDNPTVLPKDMDRLEGVLFRWTGGFKKGILRVRTRRGDEYGVRAKDIKTIRVQPPEVSSYDMQRLAQQAWPPLVTDAMGEWELRCSQGGTNRANSVRVAGPPGRQMSSMTRMIADWYGERGVSPLLQVTRPSGFDDELESAGWKRFRAGRVMTTSVARLATETAAVRERNDLEVEIREQANPEWLSLFRAYSPDTATEVDHIMESGAPSAFVYCRNNAGELLGIGRATLQDTWVGATVLDTVPQSRRRGIASAVTATMAHWALTMQASNWYVMVFNDNAAARALWERYGATTHHQYDYWALDEDALGSYE